MSVLDAEKLQGELLTVKTRASELSAEVTRQSMEIGARDQRIAQLAGVQAENDQLKARVADLEAQLRASQDAASRLSARADAGDEAVAAAKQITDALGRLSGL